MEIMKLLFFLLIIITVVLGCIYYSIAFFIGIKNTFTINRARHNLSRFPLIENALDRFIEDNIKRSKGDSVRAKDVYERYLKHNGYSKDDIGREALTIQRFLRYFKTACKYTTMVQKIEDELPELHLTDIKLKPIKEESNA